jgi:hypothetical protein
VNAKRSKYVLTVTNKAEILNEFTAVGRVFGVNEPTVRCSRKNEMSVRGSFAASAPASAKATHTLRGR